MADARQTIDRILAETEPQDLEFFDWKFKLSTRLCQIMETGSYTQPEFARMVGITEEELDDLIHFCADPPLSLMARIQALSKSELLTWVNDDVLQEQMLVEKK